MELLDSGINQHKKINFKKEIFGYLKYWYWIVLSVVLFYASALAYFRYTQPVYTSKTTLLFQESNPNKTALNDLKNLGMGVSGDEELQGEAAILVSKPILQKVAKNLNLNVTFFAKGKIREIELYDKSPYICKILSEKSDFQGSYYIEPVGEQSYRLSEGRLLKGKNTFRYGETAELPWGKIVITRNRSGYTPYRNLVVFQNTKNIVNQLEGAVKTQAPIGLLVDIFYSGEVPKKSEDILNELVKQYNIDRIEDKNAEAENTAKFINDRLDLISKELDKIELDKENFKKANKITDLDVQANIAVTRLTGNVENAFNQSSQLEILNAIYAMATSGKEQLFPTGLGLSSATETLLGQYNEMLLKKKRTLKQATDINPAVKSQDKELAEMLVSIKNNLQENREQIQQKLGQTHQEIGEDKSSIYKYPTQERVFRNIERQRDLKESLYLYLLQKREENAVTLAITTPKAKIVNPAYTLGIIKPNYKQIKIATLAMGLLFPLIIIFIIRLLDTKVRSKQDLENAGSIPVVAEVPLNPENNPKIKRDDFTIFAESFRILISNVKFILRSKGIFKGGVLLVTSSVKGEGKTTISVNTAISLAGSGKVLLIGADIRNPQLHRYFDNLKRNTKGMTDYLISENLPIKDFICESGIDKNLDILLSGTKAPNPNDLLDMDKLDEMISALKKKYDYIIMDSAPMMLVSDSLHLLDISDLVIYTVKSEFTDKEMLDFANNFKNNVKNMVFVLNNVKPRYSKYSYKYGYGYYHTGKKSRLKRDV